MAMSLGKKNTAQLDALTRGTQAGVAQFHGDPICRISECPTAFHRGYAPQMLSHPTQNMPDWPEPSGIHNSPTPVRPRSKKCLKIAFERDEAHQCRRRTRTINST